MHRLGEGSTHRSQLDLNPLPEVLLELVADRSRALHHAAARLSLAQFDSPLARGLSEAAGTAATRFDIGCRALLRSRPESGTAARPGWDLRAEQTGRLYNTFLGFLESELLPLLGQLRASGMPARVALPIRRLFQGFFPESEILVTTTNENNYRFGNIGPTIASVFQNAGCADLLAEHGLPNDIWLMQLWGMPPNGVLTHSLLSHELGHGLYERHNLERELLPELVIDNNRVRRLAEAAGQAAVDGFDVLPEGPGDGVQRRLGEYIDPQILHMQASLRVQVTARNWVQEFACDILGLCLFGPAFVMAQLYFFLPLQTLDQASDSHPSFRMRLRLVLNVLLGTKHGLGYRRTTHINLREQLEPWRSYIFERRPRPEDPYHQIAYDAVRPMLPKLVRACRRATLPFSYSWESFDSEVPYLVQRVAELLPPNEYWDPSEKQIKQAELVSIFNAGWAYHLGWADKGIDLIGQIGDSSAQSERFHGLLEKAIELAELTAAEAPDVGSDEN